MSLILIIHKKHVGKEFILISGAVPASEAVPVELVLADEVGHARGVPPLGPRHDKLPPVQPPRDQMLERGILPLRLGRRHRAPRIGVRGLPYVTFARFWNFLRPTVYIQDVPSACSSGLG